MRASTSTAPRAHCSRHRQNFSAPTNPMAFTTITMSMPTPSRASLTCSGRYRTAGSSTAGCVSKRPVTTTAMAPTRGPRARPPPAPAGSIDRRAAKTISATGPAISRSAITQRGARSMAGSQRVSAHPKRQNFTACNQAKWSRISTLRPSTVRNWAYEAISMALPMTSLPTG